MEASLRGRQAIAREWKNAWGNRYFRIKLIVGTVALSILVLTLPLFFATIEQRNGPVLNDFVLRMIPSMDLSVLTFLIIWSMIGFLIWRGLQKPMLFLTALISIFLLFLVRIFTITFIPLNPPAGLIPLKDPLSSFFYGHKDLFITKDLFFSGHTSMQFLIFLCFTRRTDKLIALLSTLLIGILVLVQHVHYTVDVIAAILLTYFIYQTGRWIAHWQPA